MEKKRIETRERAAQEVFCVCELLINFSLSLQATTAYIVQENKKNQKWGKELVYTIRLRFRSFLPILPLLSCLFPSLSSAGGGLQPSSETHKTLLPCIVRLKQPRPFFICKLRLDNLFFVNLFYYLTYFYYYL